MLPPMTDSFGVAKRPTAAEPESKALTRCDSTAHRSPPGQNWSIAPVLRLTRWLSCVITGHRIRTLAHVNFRTPTGSVDGVKFYETGRTPCDNAEASLASEKRFLPRAFRQEHSALSYFFPGRRGQ